MMSIVEQMWMERWLHKIISHTSEYKCIMLFNLFKYIKLGLILSKYWYISIVERGNVCQLYCTCVSSYKAIEIPKCTDTGIFFFLFFLLQQVEYLEDFKNGDNSVLSRAFSMTNEISSKPEAQGSNWGFNVFFFGASSSYSSSRSSATKTTIKASQKKVNQCLLILSS